ncbi:MAG: response regulator transcription factor [Chloroflexi bacterium]|nr:response regulator transcription factor [Chloroflexota bacterium]
MSKTKILVVDDEAVILNFLVRVLEREGYAVQSAMDGQAALQTMTQQPFDLLLSDIKMDRMDGVELLAEAKARYPHMAVILLTGHATVPSAIAALRNGAHNYLLKPVKNEDIVAAVESALADRNREQRRDQLEAIAAQLAHLAQPGQPPAITPDSQDERPTLSCGPLIVNVAAHSVQLDDRELDLTPTEFRLLAHLCAHPNVTFNYVALVEIACGYTASRQEAREIIGTHVLNTRRKLGIAEKQPLYIESVRGIGYRLLPPAAQNGA